MKMLRESKILSKSKILRKSRNWLCRSRRGTAAIEACFALPIFMFFTFGLFDLGWVMFRHQACVQQARAGARWGAVNPGDLTAIKNMVLYNSSSAGTSPAYGLQASNVTVTRSGQGTSNDIITVSIANVAYLFVTPGHSGYYTDRTITVSLPVEN